MTGKLGRGGALINGDNNTEDVIDNTRKKSDITMSGTKGRCVNNDSVLGNCTVKKGAAATITINSGNVLVFQDGAIRLPNS